MKIMEEEKPIIILNKNSSSNLVQNKISSTYNIIEKNEEKSNNKFAEGKEKNGFAFEEVKY